MTGDPSTTPRTRGTATFTPLVVGVAFLIAIALRFTAPSPLWLDEALSLHIATGEAPLSDALRQDGHPALYYLVLGVWIDLFGESDAAARALSGVVAVATLPVLWLAARRHGHATAVATVLLAGSSPYLIRYATEVRMYALLVLLIALGWLALERAWEQPTTGPLLAVAAATAAALHTHYWSFYAVAAAGLIIASAGWRNRSQVRRCISILGAMAVGAVTFVPWLPVFVDQLRDTGTPWADRARPTEVFIETLQGIGGNNRFEGETLGILLAFLAVVGVFAVGAARDGEVRLRADIPLAVRLPVAAALLGLGIGSLVAIATAGAFEARYAAIAIPFILVLAGRGAAVLDRRARTVVIALMIVLGFAVSIDEARRTRSQGEEVAAAIDAGVAADDVVILCPDQVGPATTHYLESDVTRRAFPSGDGYTIDWRNYLDRATTTDPVGFADAALADAGDGAIWFVTGLGYRGLDQPCATVQAHLSSQRAGQQVVGLTDVFEGMYAIRFGAS
ncbi:MAG: glycosyltransferase family 39 protein [Actinomycetota bacterium]